MPWDVDDEVLEDMGDALLVDTGGRDEVLSGVGGDR